MRSFILKGKQGRGKMSKNRFWIAACLQCIFMHISSDTLIVGTNAEFPPYSYMEEGKIVGFDIEVVLEAVHRLGKEVQLKDMPFEALLPEVILGHLDVVAAGMSETEERAKRVLFTKPHLLADPMVIFVLGTTKLGLEDLKGKTVVVVEGFTADQLMSAQEGVNVLRLPIQADAFMALRLGKADAFVTAEMTAKVFVENQKIKDYTMTVISGSADTCCLVVPKSKPELRKDLQKVLDGMEEDGTLEAIRRRWKLQ